MEKIRGIEAVKRQNEMRELIKRHMSPGTDFMDDDAVIQWLLTGVNLQVKPELQWFMPTDLSGEARMKRVLNWIENDKRQFSHLIDRGNLAAAVAISERIRAELALFEYLVETLQSDSE